MTTHVPVEMIERQQWLEPIETGLQKAVGRAYGSGGPVGRQIKNFLHGVWLGHPLHPVLTDVPIGSWTAALVLDMAEFDPGADVAVKLGLIGAAAAALAGLTDWKETDGPARRVGVVHGLLNITAASLYNLSMVARGRRERQTGSTLAYCGFAISLVSAWLGGNLVYGKQIGVNHTAGEPIPEGWIEVAREDELRDGEPRRVMAGGIKVLVVKEAGKIHAIAEVCSHLGGPLADGKVEHGTVQCPWHESRFCLADGSVIDGPATHPQPRFETRVVDGHVECGLDRGSSRAGTPLSTASLLPFAAIHVRDLNQGSMSNPMPASQKTDASGTVAVGD